MTAPHVPAALDPRDRGGAGTPLLDVHGLVKHFGG